MARSALSLVFAVTLASAPVVLACLSQARADETPAAKPETVIMNSIGMKLAAIPAGEFLMGSPESDRDANDDEKPQHSVKITRPFFMGVYEVTQGEYEKIMGTNPSAFSKTGKEQEKVVGLDTGRFPIEYVRWSEAVDFCKKLSELPGEKAAGRIYRLPTEAEWEYACRAGTTTAFHLGDSLSSTQANFNGDLPSPGAEKGPFLGRPAPVGSYEPNAFGLFDMHGNVWEWCADTYHSDYYAKSPAADPLDTEQSSDRVVRGGSWGSDAMNCRSTYRYNVLPVYRYQSRGFRVAVTVGEKIESGKPEVAKKAPPEEKPETEQDEQELVFQNKVRPFLETYCLECHSGAAPEGDLLLDRFDQRSQVATTGRKQWKSVRDKLVARAMPPEEAKQPPGIDVDFLTQWIDVALSDIDCSGPSDPGHEPIRRLTRTEYKNTVRDFLGVDFKGADDFPGDDTGAMADALSLPPVLLERYLAAAEQISSQAIANDRDRRIFFVRPGEDVSREEAARAVVENLMSRAYRRPVVELELERVLRLVVDRAHEQGRSFQESIQQALQVILASPHFLFKVEIDPSPNNPDAVRLINEYELATRMSYFLWSSMPDDELLEHARQETLRKNVSAQVARMLEDPRARALVQDFVGHSWLQLPKLQAVTPDRQRFPEFDDELRLSMRTETELFATAIMRENRSVLELIDADFTFADARLARHYGIAGVDGSEFQRVSLEGTHRGGVLTQASVLTLTSNPTRTSAVKRGKWIMENILGTPPPAPPPGVSELVEDDKSAGVGSLRKRLELHREDPRCAVCHTQMDSLGFALENFDGIGRWRDREGELPIDASGVLPDGHSFEGPGQLKAVLSTHRKSEFVTCFIEKLLTYALGRGLEYYDQCAVDKLTNTLSNQEYKFVGLITGIIESDPFQKRRGRRRSTP